jgi:hypothetical protein
MAQHPGNAAGPNDHFKDFVNQGARRPRSGAGNEGVGEHVRTKSQPAKAAGETADLWIRTE